MSEKVVSSQFMLFLLLLLLQIVEIFRRLEVDPTMIGRTHASSPSIHNVVSKLDTF